MLSNSPSSNDEPIFWFIVVDHSAGKFLSRMCVTAPQARSANRMHIERHELIRIYKESDAIKTMSQMTPLGLDTD